MEPTMSTALACLLLFSGQTCGPNGCPAPIQHVQYFPATVQPVQAPVQADDDNRLFERLKPRLLDLIEKRAAERVAEELQAAADEMNADVVVADMRGHKSVAGVILATAIAALVKKIIYSLIVAAVMAAVVGLFWKHWVTFAIAAAFAAFGVFCIAMPAGMLGGRIARKGS